MCPSNREDGKPVASVTVTRWITLGVMLSDGSRLRLPATRYPGGWRIALNDFRKFIETLTADGKQETTR
jgi:hypothetical protein